MTILSTQIMLERLASLIRTEARQALIEYGLQPIQFEALRYLAQCNRYSDTPMGVTDFLGQTKGTVSQSLKVLEREGLIKKVADKDDKRVSHLKVSTKGQRLIDKVLPSTVFTNGLANLNNKEKTDIEEKLKRMLRLVQSGNQFKSFGLCATCVYNKTMDGKTYCDLTKEALLPPETNLICREHAYPA